MSAPGNEADGRAREGVTDDAAGRAGSAVRTGAVATAGLVLAATAGLATPAAAADSEPPETKRVPCGGTVTASPGDRIQGITALGVPLDLGVVTDTLGSLLSGVCKVTVNVVDTAVRPVPGVGKPAADGVNDAVGGVTRGAKKATGRLEAVVPNPDDGDDRPAEPPPGGGEDSGSGSGGEAGDGSGGEAGGGSDGGGDGGTEMRRPNSPVVEAPRSSPSGGSGGGSALAAMSPELRYAGVPVARGASFDAAPGLRYGGQIPGYDPQFGVLGSTDVPRYPANDAGPQPGPDGQATGPAGENADLRTAGDASSLPSAASEDDGGPSLPLLLAVLALAGVGGGLVRTWVIQRTGPEPKHATSRTPLRA